MPEPVRGDWRRLVCRLQRNENGSHYLRLSPQPPKHRAVALPLDERVIEALSPCLPLLTRGAGPVSGPWWFRAVVQGRCRRSSRSRLG